MGLYRYISEEETKELKKVNDPDLNNLLQEALVHDETLLLEEEYFRVPKKGYKGWLLGQKEKIFRYTLYHESRAWDGSAYQAQCMYCVGNEVKSVSTYLYGIINGAIHSKRDK